MGHRCWNCDFSIAVYIETRGSSLRCYYISLAFAEPILIKIEYACKTIVVFHFAVLCCTHRESGDDFLGVLFFSLTDREVDLKLGDSQPKLLNRALKSWTPSSPLA